MLKISFRETPSEERWILEGRLTAPWVRKLRALWGKDHRRDNQRACIVDLNEITFIDRSGERLLRTMVNERAQFIASGTYIRHVLDKLTSKSKGSLLNRFGGFFLAAIVAAFAVCFGAECIATGVYIQHIFEQLATQGKSSLLNRLTGFFLALVVGVFAFPISATTAKAQNTVVAGSVRSGPAFAGFASSRGNLPFTFRLAAMPLWGTEI